jgi:hypothetical protein
LKPVFPRRAPIQPLVQVSPRLRQPAGADQDIQQGVLDDLALRRRPAEPAFL